MNVDEAMEIATSTAITLSKLEMAEVSEVIAAEVERLREENEWMGIAGQQMARHLAEAKAELAETKRWLDERSDAYGKACSMVDQLQNELAAAKAASVVPVEIQSVYVNKYLGSVVVFTGDENGAVQFEAWLTKPQDTTPPPAT